MGILQRINIRLMLHISPSDATTNQLVLVKFDGSGYANWKYSNDVYLVS